VSLTRRTLRPFEFLLNVLLVGDNMEVVEGPEQPRQLLEHISPEADGFRSCLPPPFLFGPSREGAPSRESPSFLLAHLLEESSTPGSSSLEPTESTESDSSRVFRFRHAGEWYHGGSGVRG